MSKRDFRPCQTARLQAAYPTTDEAHSRRGFLRELGMLLATPALAGALQACGGGDRDVNPAKKLDGGTATKDGKVVMDTAGVSKDGPPFKPPDVSSGIPDAPVLTPDKGPALTPDLFKDTGGLPHMPDLLPPKIDSGPVGPDGGEP